MCYCKCIYENYYGECRKPYRIPCPMHERELEEERLERERLENEELEELEYEEDFEYEE